MFCTRFGRLLTASIIAFAYSALPDKTWTIDMNKGCLMSSSVSSTENSGVGGSVGEYVAEAPEANESCIGEFDAQLCNTVVHVDGKASRDKAGARWSDIRELEAIQMR